MDAKTEAGVQIEPEPRRQSPLRQSLRGVRLFLASRAAWFVLVVSLTATIIAWGPAPSAFIVSAALATLTAAFRRLSKQWAACMAQRDQALVASLAEKDRLRQVSRAAVTSSDGAASLLHLLAAAPLSDEQRAALSGVRASIERIRIMACESHQHEASARAKHASARDSATNDLGAMLAPMLSPHDPLLTDLRRDKRISQELLRCNLGEIVDLSLGGMRIRTPRRSAPPTGTISIELLEVETPIVVRGEVVRLNDLGGGRFEAGIRFVELTPELTRALTRISMLHRKRLSFANAAA